MQLQGKQHIAAPRQKVWEALNDPEVLRQSLPGCQSLEKEADDRFAAVIEVKIGPIGARFNGAVTLSELKPPESYVISGSGQAGMAGSAKGSAHVQLADSDGGTDLTYTVDAEVGGRLAQLGGPIIDATAKQLAAKFFKRFEEVLVGEPVEPVAAQAPGQAPATAVAAAEAAGVASRAAPVAAPKAPGGYPRPWVISMIVAILAGFLLGRSDAADWWVAVVAILTAVAAGAGYAAGRGARP